MTIDRVNRTSAAWDPTPKAPQSRALSTVRHTGTFGELMQVSPWASRKGQVPTQPPTQPDVLDTAAPAMRPIQRAAMPIRFTAPTDAAGVSPTGVVTGPQAVSAPGVQAVTAASLAGFNGLAWAGLTKGNGNRDTTVLVPKGVDLSRPVEVIVHFHGNGGSAAASTREFKGLIEQLPTKGRNAIYVFPTTAANKRDWMSPAKGESLTSLQDEAVATVSRMAGRQVQVGRYTVAGFSGGGQPVATAAAAGQLRADHINFFDANYGEWADTAIRNRQPGATVNVFYTEHNRERAERLQGKANVTVAAAGTSHGGTPGKFFFC